MNIKKNENGDMIVSRSEDSPEIRDVIFPLAAVVATKYLSADRLGQIMQAIRDYYLCPEVTLPADAADAVIPTLGAIVDATEAAAQHRQKISRTKSDAARCRRSKTSDLPEVNLPEFVVPAELNLHSIVRAGVTIRPKEYLSVMALFLIRGYKVGEQRAFYAYYAGTQWNHGLIDGIEARMGTAQLWEQRTGEGRFRQDPSAHDLMCSLLTLLPADRRAYLLADGVRVEIKDQESVLLFVPEPLHGIILDNPKCKAAIREYAASHGLENANLGLNPISFSIEMNNR